MTTSTAARMTSSGHPTQYDYIHPLPDLAHYAKRGLIPENPELFAAIAEHTRLADAFREAISNRDEANTQLRNTPDGAAAIARAISRGQDPGEAADAAAQDRAKASRQVDRATEILAGYRMPIFQSVGPLMDLVHDFAPAADKHLQKTLIPQAAAVDAARRKLEAAQAVLHETIALGAWIAATPDRMAGDTFPRIDSAVHLYELPDPAA